MKNYDRIKSMSVEEMAKLAQKICKNMESCYTCPFENHCAESEDIEDIKQWLLQEVRDDE
jgi:hypothetical protein